MKITATLNCLAAIATAAQLSAQQEIEIIQLGSFIPPDSSRPLSGDGTRVIGTISGSINEPALNDVWDLNLGFLSNFTGTPPTGFSNPSVSGINLDGTAIAGFVTTQGTANNPFDNFRSAFVWTENGGYEILDPQIIFGRGVRTKATAITGDARYVLLNVGTEYETTISIGGSVGSVRTRIALTPVRFDRISGTALPLIAFPDPTGQRPGSSSIDRLNSSDISDDGRTVVGSTDGAEENGESIPDLAWRWTEESGFEFLETVPNLGENQETFARALSNDGKIAVGNTHAASPSAGSQDKNRALKWNESSITPEVLWNGIATDTNRDGSVIVGVQVADGAEISEGSAVRWTNETGSQSITAWLESYGVPVGDVSYQIAFGTSDDGNTIVLLSVDEDSFVTSIARLADSNGSTPENGVGGVITLDEELFQSLNGGFAAFNQIRRAPSLTINGSHHRTLMDSAIRPEGFHAWATGDFGHYDSLDSDQVQGEIGASSDFGISNFRAGMGVGYSDINQDLIFGGSSDVDGEFILGEADYRLPDAPVTFSLLGYYGNWDADIDRNYLNAGLVNTSRGSTDIDSYALRARVDWQAYQQDKWTLTPRASFTWSHTSVDGYTETGGGFPATFNSQSDNQKEVRIGLDTDYEVSECLTLRAIAEYIYTWDDSPRLTGAINGVTPFNFTGSDFSGSEFRGGLEAVYDFAENQRISVSIFGSSSEIAPAVSGAVSYGIQF